MAGNDITLAARTIRLIGWAAAAVLLALPAIAMQFTNEVNWGPEDFLAMGLMLLALGLGLEGTHRLVKQRRPRLVLAALLILLFLAVWAELAVGIFE